MTNRLRHIIGCVALGLISLQAMAMSDCEWRVKTAAALGIQYPYYYCDCLDNTEAFAFGMDRIISDTTWFTASVDDLKQGLSAYWFADCSVTMEVYAACNASTPTLTITVGRNTMQEKDVESINKKLDELGEIAQTLSQLLTPHIRVYPHGCSGRVMCYAYDKGPHSTCSDPLPILNEMTYVSNHSDEVYELKTGTAVDAQIAMQWKQEKNQPCEVYVTKETCEGETIAHTTLSDSTKLFYLGGQIVSDFKTGNYSLFFHIQHDSTKVGRTRFLLKPTWINQEESVGSCQGKGLELADTTLLQTTLYIDTAWISNDTIGITTYDLQITTPNPIPDTLYIKSNLLPTVYRNAEVISEYGDYMVTVHKDGQCDKIYALHVQDEVIDAVENVHIENDSPCKILQDGTLYIIYNKKRYTLLGVEL